MGWQPENTPSLVEAIARLERELPGWWWRVGSCHVSSDATVAPDSEGPDADLLDDRLFDEGFDCDLAQPSSCGEALNGAIDSALRARARAKAEST